ncbi:MAG: Fis family transcriptional regulator [Gammaproteobacteria bacterium SG8_47]|nr:MAG: Fis family transcriptional regulator [Gammaproteobacteria bacterium SG8_47]
MQSHRNVVAFGVGSESAQKPLRECVTVALRNYFEHLDGTDAAGLYQMVLQEIEEPLLQAVLDYTGGNQTKAAEILGINRATLRKKLKHYGLD